MTEPSARLMAARGVLVVSSLLVALVLCEGLLRLQDRYYPLVRLSGFEKETPRQLSYRFHHRLGDSDQNVQISTVPAAVSDNQSLSRILFLGDSWLENGGIVDGVSTYLQSTRRVPTRVELLNGGTNSFSPSLIMLQGELLIAKYHPDLVIVNIDETDLMDESVRYRPVSIFDASDRLVAVVPSVLDRVGYATLKTLNHQPLYICRLVERVYLREVYYRRMRRDWRDPRDEYEGLFAPQLSDDPMRTHSAEIAYFDERVSEMIERLGRAVGRNRLLVTHHPHFLHFGRDAQGRQYNHIVRDRLSELTARHGVALYDASQDMRKIHGDAFKTAFNWPKDRFSHLTIEGYRHYGAAIAEHFEARIMSAFRHDTVAVTAEGATRSVP
jgi:hypothetical protein